LRRYILNSACVVIFIILRNFYLKFTNYFIFKSLTILYYYVCVVDDISNSDLSNNICNSIVCVVLFFLYGANQTCLNMVRKIRI